MLPASAAARVGVGEWESGGVGEENFHSALTTHHSALKKDIEVAIYSDGSWEFLPNET
ncbi:hypothetical protein [Argonema galeatum]|uniref:hypothetical protein n=1 Tax=Argonema galeatum TaxID=2942762 RepID=UPI00201263AA|nr:hypothetical protein [Argonema galeatum]MCL1466284.1 hypothetical protein [Argonema galeatum A003/A1]